MYSLIDENAFEHVVWKKAAILSRPQCVNIIYMVDLVLDSVGQYRIRRNYACFRS